MADLHRLRIEAGPDEAELLTAVLALNVQHGWEEENLPDGRTRFCVHAHEAEFCRELEREINAVLPGLEIRRDTTPELDWVSSWKDFFTPVPAGSRFLVLAPWMEKEKKEAAPRLPIIIEPKTAFGTGHHATTALCLAALSDLADAGHVKAGQRFLDLGTGSGILGIGAALLGLQGVGVDPDRLAVENALENRALNGVAPEDFVVRRGSLEAAGEEKFDLILANILAEPLINLAPALVRHLRPGASLALSGVLNTQAAQVEAAYRAAGLGAALITPRDEWVSLVWTNIKV